MEFVPTLVSVIIPVLNGEAFLAEAVASVFRQTFRPIEIIIVDDGSTDNTAKVASGYDAQVRYLFQPHSGQAAARNTGLRQATGDVIAFLDADDMWTDDKLELQLGYLAGNPLAGVVLGSTPQARENGRPQYGLEDGTRSDPLVALSLGAAIFKKSVFEQVGLFDERLPFCEDIDWFLRAWEQNISIALHPEVVQFYRRHGGNITNRRDLDQRYFIRAVKMSLDRRRRQGNGTPRPLPPWLELSQYSASNMTDRRPTIPKT
jgi:glycosyltransferase involved in cell wall biosynthesis